MSHLEAMTNPNRATGGDVLVRVMRRHGVDIAFGVISAHNLPLVEAVDRDLRFIPMRHEAAAVNAADAYARVTGKFGVALTGTGTGAGNAAGAMVEALTAGSRVLHITGQIHSEFLGRNRGLNHEFPHQLQMLDAVSGYARTVFNCKDAEADLEEAIAHLKSLPHTPSRIEWPIDLQYLAQPDEQRAIEVSVSDVPQATATTLNDAATLLAKAQRPLIWAGGGAAEAGEALTALVQRLGAGLLTTDSGRGIVSEDNELVIGNFVPEPAVFELLADADLLLSIGTHFDSQDHEQHHFELPTPHIQIDIDADALGRSHPIDIGLVGRARSALDAINSLLDNVASNETPDSPANGTWASRIKEVRHGVRSNLTEHLDGYAEICRSLRRRLPRQSVLARDAAIPSLQWANRLFPVYSRETNVFPASQGTGHGLAMALGAACARTDVPTTALLGERSLSAQLGELAALVETNAWCVVVLFTGSGRAARGDAGKKNGVGSVDVKMKTPDFELISRSFNIPFWRVQTTESFDGALTQALNVRGAAIIEVELSESATLAH